MGNTITKSSDDGRFGDSLLAKEIKNIVQNQTSTYKDKEIKIHVAKACCREVVRPDIANEQNNVVSIAFPIAADPKSERCSKNGICLETGYVGFQIADDRAKWCGSDKEPGIAGYNFSTIRGGGANSVCDNFMMDNCAKNLYEQGCIKMGKNKAGALVPQFANASENKMCWDDQNKMNYGPPECHCLNSMFGPNLNTWPAKELDDKTFGTKNPYGLEGRQTDSYNTFSKYSLNVFKAANNQQYPRALDTRCSAASDSGSSKKSKAYTLERDKTQNMTICLNQINIADSNIGNANLDDIKQENNCGGPAPSKQEPTSDSVPVNPDQKIDPALKAAADKKILDDAAAKKKLEDDAKALADALAAAKKKAEEDAKAMADAKAKADAELKKAREDAEKAKAEAEKAKADAENAKTTIPVPIISGTTAQPSTGSTTTQPSTGSTTTQPSTGSTTTQPASGSTTTQPASGSTTTQPASGSTTTQPASGSTTTQPASGSTTQEPSSTIATTQSEEEQKSRNTMFIAGGVLLVIIIGIIIFSMSGKSKPAKYDDDE